MKKRTAILILTLITMFCFVPMSASAAESNVIRVSTQEEFNKAIARVNEDSDSEYTIELTDDFSITGFSINSPHKATILGSGHTLTMPVGGSVHVDKGAELTLGAADGNVLNIRSTENTNDAPGMLNIEGTCNMYSGVKLSGRVGNNYFGGGVTVSGGTFHMYGGTIEKCGIKGGSVCYGGGVAVVYGGQFIMDSGTIKDCYVESDYIDYLDPNTCFTAMGGGVFVSGGSYFRMNGGSISNNRATNMGGGVAVAISYDEIANSGSYGTLKSSAEILGGKVEENKAKKGAGVFVSAYYYAYANAICADTPAAGASEKPGLYVKNAQILGNTADTSDGMGGGVLVAMLKSPAAASVENATVKGNKAATGAGIASYGYYTNMNIKGGTVTENTAQNYGGGFAAEIKKSGGKRRLLNMVRKMTYCVSTSWSAFCCPRRIFNTSLTDKAWPVAKRVNISFACPNSSFSFSTALFLAKVFCKKSYKDSQTWGEVMGFLFSTTKAPMKSISMQALRYFSEARKPLQTTKSCPTAKY